jgi:hypothetical protein
VAGVPPHKRLFPVAGRSGIATIKGQLVNMRDGGFISAHDFHIASLIANVVCGGDVDAGTLVSEEYLMALERKAFCALLEHPKTQERIMGMLQTASRCGIDWRGEHIMTKQVQDAYIVAATRTPIGRSGRGYFRNTRPDDLLVARGAQRAAQVPGPRPRRPSRTPSSAAPSPRRAGHEHGAHRRWCWRAAAFGGRRHRQPLLRQRPDGGADGGRPHPRGRGRRDDRRRRRKHEHGAHGRQQAQLQPRGLCNTATRTSALPTAWA